MLSAVKRPFSVKTIMSLIDNIFRKKKEEPAPVKEERGLFDGLGLQYGTFSTYSSMKAMQLSTAYACTNIISNAVALLPIKVKQYENGKMVDIEHKLKKVLNLTPNQKYNHFDLFKLLIESLILNGNGYLYIERDERLNVKALHLLNPAFVQPMLQEDGTVKYIVEGMNSAVDAMNMIHLFMHCDEMMNGISLLKYAARTLNAAWDTEDQSNKFYQRGAGLLGVLKASAPLTDAQKTQIALSWEKSISKTASGGVAILPQGLDFQAISVNPEDAQLLESRQYGVIDICRFFNVSPLKVFDYSHMSYSSLEQVTLSFMQDTILPYAQLIEDEFNRKLFKPSEVGKYYIDFDFTSIIGTDKKTEAEYYRTLVTNGLITISEARERLGFAPLDGEQYNETYMQLSYGSVKNIADGLYIKQNPQTAEGETKVDNKQKEKDKE
jgi:HK97 family phage portal protein